MEHPGATGATGPTDSLGHTGYTGPDFIHPTGMPGFAGATGPGTAVVTSAYQLTPEYRLGDGLHEHRSYAQFVPAKLNVSAHPVEQPTVATPLEGAVVFVAVGGALSPASAATWPRLRRLLNSIRTRVVGSAGRVAHDAGRLLRRSAR